jgi:hypothetical protein
VNLAVRTAFFVAITDPSPDNETVRPIASHRVLKCTLPIDDDTAIVVQLFRRSEDDGIRLILW